MAEVSVLGLAVDGVSNIEKAQKALTGFSSAAGRAEKGASSLSRESRELDSRFSNLNRTLASTAKSMLALGAAAFGIREATRTLANFEKSMATVAGVTRSTESELRRMRDMAKDLGATTEFTASQAADAFRFLGMAGFSASEAIASIPAVLDLATGASLDLARAADISTNVMSGFGIAAENSAKVADVLAAAAIRANTDVSQLGAAMSTVAPIAQGLGISIEDTTAAIGALSDAGIQGQRAGTGLRGVLASLAGPTTQAQKALRSLGLTVQDINPDTNDLSDIFRRLNEAGLSSADSIAIFGREASSAALVLAAAHGRLEEFGDELRNSEGEAARLAGTMRDNLAGDLNSVGSAIEGLVIAMGDAGLTAAMRAFLQLTTEAIRSISSLVDRLGQVAGVIARALAPAFTWLNPALTAVAKNADIAVIALAGFAAPTLLAGVKALTVALGVGLVKALNAVRLAMLANPIGAIAAALVAAGVAAWRFRDAISDAIGVDVTAIVSSTANKIIAFFVAAKEEVAFSWKNLGDIMGATMISAVNASISAINALVRASTAAIDFMIRQYNKLPFTDPIQELSDRLSIDKYENTYLNNLAPRLEKHRDRLASIFSTDWISEIWAGGDSEDVAGSGGPTDVAEAIENALSSIESGLSGATDELKKWIKETALATKQNLELAEAYLTSDEAIAKVTRQHEIENQVLEHGEKARAAITSAVNAHEKSLARLDIAKNIRELRQQTKESQAYVAVLSAQSIGIEEGREALEEFNKQIALQEVLAGAAADEVADLVALWNEAWDQSAAMQRQVEASQQLNQLVESTATTQEAYNRELERLVALRPYAKTEEQAVALSRAIKDLQRENNVFVKFTEDALNRIDEGWANIWEDMISGSRNAFDSVKQGFRKFLAELAHAALTRPIIISVQNALTGSNLPGGIGGGGGLFGGVPGGGGFLGSIAGKLSGIGTQAASIGSIGFANAVGAAGGDAIGALIAANPAWTSAASSIAGAAGAAIGAIGTALPWIGAGITAFSLLKDAFSGETREGGSFWLQDGRVERLGGPSGGSSSAATQFVGSLLEQATGIIERGLEAAGASAILDGLIFAYESSEKGRGGVYSFGDIIVDGDRIRFGGEERGQGYGSRTGTVEDMLRNLEVDASITIIKAFQAAIEQLPGVAQDLLRDVDADALGQGAGALVETLIQTLEQVNALATALDNLPFVPSIAATRDFASALMQLVGGAENANNLLASFYQNYYTEAERAAWLTEQLTSSLAEIGLDLPRTRYEFRALVEANLALGEAGAETVAILLGLESALSSILPEFDQLGDAQLGMLRQLSDETARLLGLRNRAGIMLDQINRAMGREGVFGVAREAELWASITTANYDQQLEIARELTDIVLERYNEEIASAERLRDIGRSLREYVQSLTISDLSPLTTGERLAEAGAQFASLLAQAQAGDESAAERLQPAADAYLQLARDYYASADEYTQIFRYITGSLDAFGIQAETDAERQINIAEDSLAQLDRLRGIAESAYNTLDRQYQQSLQALHAETEHLASIGADTGRLHDIAALLASLPAEIAAQLQGYVGGAASGVVGNWYQQAGFDDPMGQKYWADQLQQRPADMVQQDYLATLVSDWYKDNLGWLPDQQGLAYWVSEAQRLGASRAFEDWKRAAGIDGSHEAGLWNVPFDGYVAQLHRGEAVLPRHEASSWRSGSDSPVVSELQRVNRRLEASQENESRLLQLLAETVARSAKANAEDIREELATRSWERENQVRYGAANV